jgi:site-specific DNA-methyltransferase (adenine-specific)
MEKVVIGAAELYHGDALAVLAQLESQRIDCLLTDPPYSSGGMMRGDRTQSVHTKYVNTDSASGLALPAFSGDNRDQAGYWFWLSIWLSESRRVIVPGGIAGLFTDWRQLPVTASAIQSGGFVWRGIVTWHKPGARPVLGRFTNACEYLVWGTNGPRPLAGGVQPGFVSCPSPRGQERAHITQKPIELMEALVKIAPEGGTIADLFMGSGTTAVAALTSGRRFIGAEIDRQAFDHACERARLAQSGWSP